MHRPFPIASNVSPEIGYSRPRDLNNRPLAPPGRRPPPGRAVATRAEISWVLSSLEYDGVAPGYLAPVRRGIEIFEIAKDVLRGGPVRAGTECG